jgi:hypothetical protein
VQVRSKRCARHRTAGIGSGDCLAVREAALAVRRTRTRRSSAGARCARRRPPADRVRAREAPDRKLPTVGSSRPRLVCASDSRPIRACCPLGGHSRTAGRRSSRPRLVCASDSRPIHACCPLGGHSRTAGRAAAAARPVGIVVSREPTTPPSASAHVRLLTRQQQCEQSDRNLHSNAGRDWVTS